ncbi:MAG TPA: hypothetical protein V6D25_06105 [Leptolyngbyaceae cyanobacterium]
MKSVELTLSNLTRKIADGNFIAELFQQLSRRAIAVSPQNSGTMTIVRSVKFRLTAGLLRSWLKKSPLLSLQAF